MRIPSKMMVFKSNFKQFLASLDTKCRTEIRAMKRKTYFVYKLDGMLSEVADK